MIEIEYYNSSRLSLPISLANLERLGEIVQKYERRLRGKITLWVVDQNEIRKLNKQFRGKNKVTDVLSFPLNSADFFPEPEGERHLGELFMCPVYIRKQAERFQVSFKNEFIRMLVHGLLHIAGQDHLVAQEAEKMFVLQEKIIVEVYQKVFKQKVETYPVHLLKQREGIYLE